MKKILSVLLALALMLGAAALAEGNVTIAVQGMNDFNDNIQSMIVYGDKLLLSSWDTLYTWDNTSRKLTPVDGYDKLQNVLTGDGETPGALELNDGEYAYLDGNLYAVGGKLYRMATISDEDGNSTNQLVELLIADDGALSLGGDHRSGRRALHRRDVWRRNLHLHPQPEQPLLLWQHALRALLRRGAGAAGAQPRG